MQLQGTKHSVRYHILPICFISMLTKIVLFISIQKRIQTCRAYEKKIYATKNIKKTKKTKNVLITPKMYWPNKNI